RICCGRQLGDSPYAVMSHHRGLARRRTGPPGTAHVRALRSRAVVADVARPTTAGSRARADCRRRRLRRPVALAARRAPRRRPAPGPRGAPPRTRLAPGGRSPLPLPLPPRAPLRPVATRRLLRLLGLVLPRPACGPAPLTRHLLCGAGAPA